MRKRMMRNAATYSETGTLSGLTQVSRVSLSEHIVEQIASLISQGVLKPGDRIPSEKQLCRQFGVGRTSVREALRSLAMMGVLETHMGDGTFVRPDTGRFIERSFQWGLLLNHKDVEDLVETRLMLESQTAYLAATRATETDLEKAAEAIRCMEAAVSKPEQYLEHDLSFHLIIAGATQNTILASLLSTTRGYLRSFIREALAEGKRARMSIAEHKRILQALKVRDAEAARQAMEAHILSPSVEVKEHLVKRRNAVLRNKSTRRQMPAIPD
jgi:GntR family transcriptional regulator, transcriptional repressor for pyruvate dehydrogenase complex